MTAWRVTEQPLVVGVDVGGSKIAALVVESDGVGRDSSARSRFGTVRGRFTRPMTAVQPDAAADAIAAAVEAALADAGATRAEVAAVGVGVPGRVDPGTGTVALAVNLGWTELRLGPQLEDRLGLPVRLENDVRAAAAGLHERGVVGSVRDLAYLGIGTGISAGIVLGGRLHRGSRGMAGEIGHIVLDPAGPPCACGLRGCFEALAAGPAVGRRAAQLLAEGRPSSLASEPAPTATDVYRAAADGDLLASAIAAEVGGHVARAVHELVMAYDVEVVVLGGGVAGAGDAFLDPILRALDRLRDASPLAREVLGPGVVHLLPADAEAGAWGALVLAAAAANDPAASALAGREVGHG